MKPAAGCRALLCPGHTQLGSPTEVARLAFVQRRGLVNGCVDAPIGWQLQRSKIQNNEGQFRVGSSSWKGGEAAVHRRLTLKRRVTSTLLPDCAIKPPAAEADLLSPSTLAPVPRPQLPIETENVFPRLFVAAPDQPVELTKPAIP